MAVGAEVLHRHHPHRRQGLPCPEVQVHRLVREVRHPPPRHVHLAAGVVGERGGIRKTGTTEKGEKAEGREGEETKTARSQDDEGGVHVG